MKPRIIIADNDINYIIPTDDRPLSKDREALEARFRERYSRYMGTCDKEIKSDEILTHTVSAIKEDFLK